MNERDLKERLEGLNFSIKATQKAIDEKKKAIETTKRSKKAEVEYARLIAEAESSLNILKEQDEAFGEELKKEQGNN